MEYVTEAVLKVTADAVLKREWKGQSAEGALPHGEERTLTRTEGVR